MSNNPFRSKPSTNVQQSADDWGKTKFKPSKFGSGGKKPFNKHQGGRGGNRKFDNRNGNSFQKKETCKFNQVARDAKPENGTPWNKYKDEIVYKQREEEQAAQQANMDSSEGRSVLKQREINYRKSLIEKKKQEPTHWEDFGEEDDTHKNSKKFSNKSKPNKTATLTNQNDEGKKKKFNNKQKSAEHKLDTQSKPNFKKNVSNSELKADVKEFISKELLDNFDSKKLSFKQNNKLRAVITKTTNMSVVGNSLEHAVQHMKYDKMKKEKFNKK
ncbi:uncharacterized protein LOC135951072 [Calliphora vicina]|uniref:uncharacterized protein LOC135951072 n=1 Tax=Calliphora vicina TaxID=7373 RepID=UPI00325BF46D